MGKYGLLVLVSCFSPIIGILCLTYVTGPSQLSECNFDGIAVGAFLIHLHTCLYAGTTSLEKKRLAGEPRHPVLVFITVLFSFQLLFINMLIALFLSINAAC